MFGAKASKKGWTRTHERLRPSEVETLVKACQNNARRFRGLAAHWADQARAAKGGA